MSPLLYYALPALGSYVMVSFFFLRRPRLLHTPWVPAFRPRLGAHRGGSGERLENTMEAMENSMAQRADLLELDCHLTRDGVVVVSHDKNLFRQTGVNRDVGSLNFEDLPLLKEELEVYFSPGKSVGCERWAAPTGVGSPPQPPASSSPLGPTPCPWALVPTPAILLPSFSPPPPGHFARGADRHMLRLEDLFRRFPRTPMSVEVKERNEELIHKIAGLVRHYDRNEITIWASEKSSIMKKCKAANPEMPTSFTLSRGFWVLLFYYLGLLPFISIPEKFLICFLPTIINRTYFPFSRSGLNQLAAVVAKWLIMRKSLIQHLQQRGVQVSEWLFIAWACWLCF
ncbi:lysophospholipase D GDPD3 isoform X1 [Capricornis sumatraensis]|uniref:lysophospholipase D GDPD3 isoform X1 n=1 Tax=Capricornis sumatraensis TaxID=34865 RepID=UPI0036046E72